MNKHLARLLSHVWPVRVWKGIGANGELELTWEYGQLVVNSANANQSFGSLHRVWRQAFRDAGIARHAPTKALILGYGAGSAAHLLWNEFDLATGITGVDHDATVLHLARTHFPLRPKRIVDLVCADAFTFVTQHTTRYDLVIVDLFQDLDFTGGVEAPLFLRELRRLVSGNGLLLVNTVVHDEKSAVRSARLGDELRLVFTDVQERRYEQNNRVFMAL